MRHEVTLVHSLVLGSFYVGLREEHEARSNASAQFRLDIKTTCSHRGQ